MFPRTGIIAATILIVVLGSTRFLIGWDKVYLWRNLLAFIVFRLGALATLRLTRRKGEERRPHRPTAMAHSSTWRQGSLWSSGRQS